MSRGVVSTSSSPGLQEVELPQRLGLKRCHPAEVSTSHGEARDGGGGGLQDQRPGWPVPSPQPRGRQGCAQTARLLVRLCLPQGGEKRGVGGRWEVSLARCARSGQPG